MEDPEELALRKELIATKTPKELSAITSLDEFPLPTKIETLVRKKKRTLAVIQWPMFFEFRWGRQILMNRTDLAVWAHGSCS